MKNEIKFNKIPKYMFYTPHHQSANYIKEKEDFDKYTNELHFHLLKSKHSLIKPHDSTMGYVRTGSRLINESLYKLKIHKTPIHAHIKNLIKNIQDDFKNTENEHEFHVYCGIHPESELYHKISDIKGMVYTHPPFLSTSLDPKIAASFASPKTGFQTHDMHILNIKIPVNQKFLYTSSFSGLRYEREVLLPHNTTLHIGETPQKLKHGFQTVYVHQVTIK